MNNLLFGPSVSILKFHFPRWHNNCIRAAHCCPLDSSPGFEPGDLRWPSTSVGHRASAKCLRRNTQINSNGFSSVLRLSLDFNSRWRCHIFSAREWEIKKTCVSIVDSLMELLQNKLATNVYCFVVNSLKWLAWWLSILVWQKFVGQFQKYTEINNEFCSSGPIRPIRLRPCSVFHIGINLLKAVVASGSWG